MYAGDFRGDESISFNVLLLGNVIFTTKRNKKSRAKLGHPGISNVI